MTDGVVESDERGQWIGYSNGDISSLRSDKVFEEREGIIRVSEVEKVLKSRKIVSGTVIHER